MLKLFVIGDSEAKIVQNYLLTLQTYGNECLLNCSNIKLLNKGKCQVEGCFPWGEAREWILNAKFNYKVHIFLVLQKIISSTISTFSPLVLFSSCRMHWQL